MIIFNNTSADFVLISVENDHNFEQNEDRATVILKWTDFRGIKIIILFSPIMDSRAQILNDHKIANKKAGWGLKHNKNNIIYSFARWKSDYVKLSQHIVI